MDYDYDYDYDYEGNFNNHNLANVLLHARNLHLVMPFGKERQEISALNYVMSNISSGMRLSTVIIFPVFRSFWG
jgi:hypothetical protein